MFSERLKLARKRSGLSLRALSSRIGGRVSAQAIGKYERGEMMPSSTVAIALAEALDVTMSYLLSPSSVSLESVEFRKEASTKARERAAVEAEVLDQATAARSRTELQAEIATLRGLERLARQVLSRSDDTKWRELAGLLRKIFTPAGLAPHIKELTVRERSHPPSLRPVRSWSSSPNTRTRSTTCMIASPP